MIPGNSELTFELDVLACESSIEKINDKNEADDNRALRVVENEYNSPKEAADADNEDSKLKKESKE